LSIEAWPTPALLCHSIADIELRWNGIARVWHQAHGSRAAVPGAA
jgi:hypothetical protein